MPERAWRPDGVTRDAASPMISMSFTSDSANWRSWSRSLRALPCTNVTASFAASSICCSRTRSSGGGKLHLCAVQYLLAEVATQVGSRAQIHGPAEYCGELALSARQPDEPDGMSWLELDQHVYVTIGPKVITQ